MDGEIPDPAVVVDEVLFELVKEGVFSVCFEDYGPGEGDVEGEGDAEVVLE